MTRLGLIYARFSLDEAGEFSIDSQIRRGLEHAQNNDIHIPDEFVLADEFSGFTLDRPQFNTVKRLISERRIACVIVYKVNRIARKSHLADYFLQEIIFPAGVELHIIEWGRPVQNTKDDLLLFGLQAQFAQFDAMNIKEQTMRGKQERLDQGVWVGQGISKYGFHKEYIWKDWRGKKRRETELRHVDDEVQTVLRIFERFVKYRREGSKHAISSICDELDAEHIPTPSQARHMKTLRTDWNPSMIYSILRDEAYIGTFHFYKQRRTRLAKGHGTSVFRPKSEWQPVVMPHLRVIPQELWDAAQELLNNGRGVNKEPLYDYLMNKRLTCAVCDNRYTVGAMSRHGRKDKVYTYYACASHRLGRRALPNASKCALPPNIWAERIDRVFWQWVCMLSKDPEAVLVGYQKIQRAQTTQHQDIIDEIDRARKRIAGYEQELAKYADMLAKELIPEKLMREKKDEIDRKQASAQAVIDEYETKLRERKMLTDEEIQRRVQSINDLKAAVDDFETLTFEERKEAIRMLDVTGRLGLKGDRVYIDILWCREYQDTVWLDSQYS
jgi:DNA invertase Pin-like site-specific DNA recombinase